MKRILLTIFAIIASLNVLFTQNDTLNVIFEFNSPTPNPWGLTFDGTDFWVSDHISGMIYKSNPTGQTVDSIEVISSMITGISFVNDTLWALNSKIVKDTIMNTSAYPVYFLYKIDKSNGHKIDSIEIIGSATNLQSGDLWGLEFHNDKFYISYNGGYGPCLIEVERNGICSDLCCTHLVGMTVAYDSIWAIRYGGDLITVTNGYDENWKYRIVCNATDLAYDGENFWVIDTADNKIKKLEGVTALISNLNENNDFHIFPNPTKDYFNLTPGKSNIDIQTIVITDINGRIVENIRWNKNDSQRIDISHLLKGVYFIAISNGNKVVIKKIVKK
ncbi:MAG: T9SS type A sorting domain-containing protein [Bacteroidales bacterium]|nr:T9SS type A sorting domain-containing protein [Bacteroidales bacterium]